MWDIKVRCSIDQYSYCTKLSKLDSSISSILYDNVVSSIVIAVSISGRSHTEFRAHTESRFKRIWASWYYCSKAVTSWYFWPPGIIESRNVFITFWIGLDILKAKKGILFRNVILYFGLTILKAITEVQEAIAYSSWEHIAIVARSPMSQWT